MRAATAKEQGQLRRTDYGTNQFRFPSKHISKNDIYHPKYSPEGHEVYGK